MHTLPSSLLSPPREFVNSFQTENIPSSAFLKCHKQLCTVCSTHVTCVPPFFFFPSPCDTPRRKTAQQTSSMCPLFLLVPVTFQAWERALLWQHTSAYRGRSEGSWRCVWGGGGLPKWLQWKVSRLRDETSMKRISESPDNTASWKWSLTFYTLPPITLVHPDFKIHSTWPKKSYTLFCLAAISLEFTFTCSYLSKRMQFHNIFCHAEMYFQTSSCIDYGRAGTLWIAHSIGPQWVGVSIMCEKVLVFVPNGDPSFWNVPMEEKKINPNPSMLKHVHSANSCGQLISYLGTKSEYLIHNLFYIESRSC